MSARRELDPWERKHLDCKRSFAQQDPDGTWRIKRHDGITVGAYETRILAEKAIVKQAWFL